MLDKALLWGRLSRGWRVARPSAPIGWGISGAVMFLALLYGVSMIIVRLLTTTYTPVKPVLLRPFADYRPWSGDTSFALSQAAVMDNAADRRRADDMESSLWQRLRWPQPTAAPGAAPALRFPTPLPTERAAVTEPIAAVSATRPAAGGNQWPTVAPTWPAGGFAPGQPTSPPTITVRAGVPPTGEAAGAVPELPPTARVQSTATPWIPQATATARPASTEAPIDIPLAPPTQEIAVPSAIPENASPPFPTATTMIEVPAEPSPIPQATNPPIPQQPTATRTVVPTVQPSATRTIVPSTATPTAQPSATRTVAPSTATPTDLPTATPTDLPTATPGVLLSPGLRAEYYERGLTTPVLTRLDPTINFSWGAGSPDPALPSDNFSARWVGFIEPRFSERYSITISFNASARVWINDQLIINAWHFSGGSDAASITLQQDQRAAIVIEYFEDTSTAAVRLGWQSPSQPWEIIPQQRLYPPNASSAAPNTGTGLEGTYYRDNAEPEHFFGHLVASGIIANLDLFWSDAEFPGLQKDLWGGRWTGVLIPRYSETYEIITRSDDGVRVWIDGQLVINNWTHHGITEDRGTITLVANQPYTLRVELFDYINKATIQLSWASPSQVREVVPADRLLHQTQ